MAELQFDGQNVSAYFDIVSGYMYATYGPVISAETTISVYAWGTELANEIGVSAIKGIVIDFRAVTQFEYSNLRIATEVSRNLNEEFDLSTVPAALLVKNMYQEQLVKVSMKLTDRVERMRMVHTEAEALKFIENWHSSLNPTAVDDEDASESSA